MISYDVCSLSANIPLKENVELVVSLIFQKRPGIKIRRKQITTLFEFATSGTHF